MRYRMILLASLLAGTLAITTTASAMHQSPNVKRQQLSKTRISGTIESFQGNRATVITEDGNQVGVALGPRDYWGRRGGDFRVGQRITADCWGDPYDRSDWYFAGSVWGPGFYIELTNDMGVPYWVDDFQTYDGWCPCYDEYADWYGCGPVVYNYMLPPPPPPRYYYWYPRGYYPVRYRHYYRSFDYDRYDRGRHDRGNHNGWDRGRRGDGDDRGHYDRRDDRRDIRRDTRGDNRREGRRIRGR